MLGLPDWDCWLVDDERVLVSTYRDDHVSLGAHVYTAPSVVSRYRSLARSPRAVGAAASAGSTGADVVGRSSECAAVPVPWRERGRSCLPACSWSVPVPCVCPAFVPGGARRALAAPRCPRSVGPMRFELTLPRT
ncbi:DUF6879 family protein [Salinifilum ghardaiensis]